MAHKTLGHRPAAVHSAITKSSPNISIVVPWPSTGHNDESRLMILTEEQATT